MRAPLVRRSTKRPRSFDAASSHPRGRSNPSTRAEFLVAAVSAMARNLGGRATSVFGGKAYDVLIRSAYFCAAVSRTSRPFSTTHTAISVR
jgi:hypothetical protein